DAALRRLSQRVRVRLDAAARRPATSRGRSRFRAVRPRRLAGTARRGFRQRRRASLRDARADRADGALAARAGDGRAWAQNAFRRGAGRRGRRRRAQRQRGADMKAFARMYAALDASNKTNAKLAALAEYFAQAPPADGAWAVFFLSG